MLVAFYLPCGYTQEVDENSEISTNVADDEDVYTVWNRLREGFKVPDLENPVVEENLQRYLNKPDYLNRMTQRSKPFLYHILEEVEKRKLPTEIAILPFVESAFVTKAKSHAKAAGLWQFMPQTGKHFQLNQNMWKDERYDVFDSTSAAVTYLERLYDLFGDWQLAFAAYNWGEGNVQRAIKKNQQAGLPTDYMSLKMPSETRNYYPKLQAIKEIILHPGKYNLKLPAVYNEPSLVEISKEQDIDVKNAAKFAGLSESSFIDLNPAFNRPVIVAAHNNRMLLPSEDVDSFVENLVTYSTTGKPLSKWTTYRVRSGDTLASIAKRANMTEQALRETNKIPENRRVKEGSLLLVNKGSGIASSEDISADTIDGTISLQQDFRRIKYRVRKGDSLPRIAKRLGVSVAQISNENRLRKNRISVGQDLVVTVPVRTRQYTEAASPAPSKASVQSAAAPGNKFYVVRKGDTLYNIASRYNISVASLKSANDLKDNNVTVGQRLSINASGTPPRRTVVLEKLPPSVAKQVAKRPLAGKKTYKVKAGDTLFSIASNANLSVDELKKLNNIKNNSLKAGMTLKLSR
jgi:membrane-bound lytic murein transglycosylase D